MYINDAQSTEEDLLSMAEKRYLNRSGDSVRDDSRQRSHSLSTYEQSRARSLVERMKHTFEYKLNESKGFNSYKGNIRSEYIRASFVTLEDLFVKLPESVSFDIEISKSPCVSEQVSCKSKCHRETNHVRTLQSTLCYSKPTIGEWKLSQ